MKINSNYDKIQNSYLFVEIANRVKKYTAAHPDADIIKLAIGDYDPSNIIITDDGKYYILDWSHATTGNGSADASRTYLLFKLKGRDDLAEKYMELYCELNNTTRHYVSKWLPIVAASQSVKGKPEEREFLMKWATIAEYE